MTEFFGSFSAAAGERRVGEIELALLEVGPAEAVEVRGIVGLDLERALDERRPPRRASVPLLGQHVAEVVERAGVERILRDHVAEHLLDSASRPACRGRRRAGRAPSCPAGISRAPSRGASASLCCSRRCSPGWSTCGPAPRARARWLPRTPRSPRRSGATAAARAPGCRAASRSRPACAFAAFRRAISGFSRSTTS